MTIPYFILATPWTYFFSSFSSFNGEKRITKYYNKRITIHGNGNVQSHDKEESKLNSAIKANGGAHTITHEKIIKSPFNNNIATIKNIKF